MRIDGFNSAASDLAGGVGSAQSGAANSASAGTSSAEDRATLSSDSASIGTLASQALKSPEVRQDKVDSLRLAVTSGQYEVDPEKIASSIVNEYA